MIIYYILFEGDSLTYHVGMKFSTRDQDNDMRSSRDMPTCSHEFNLC